MAVVHGRSLSALPATSPARRRVVVKLREEFVDPSTGVAADAAVRAAWPDIEGRYPGVAMRPYFRARPAGDAQTSEAATSRVVPLIDSRRYLAVEVPAGTSADEVAATLREAAGVETAYTEGGPTPPPVNPDDDPRSASQGYLAAAPDGVDARFLWQFVDGTGVGFVDMERGWTLDHEDLEAANIQVISGVSRDFHGHGTAVLGEVVGVDNTLGGIGIASGATTRVISQWRSDNDEDYGTADAIVGAAAVMQPGDVLLLEAQTRYPTTGDRFVPVEVEELVFDAIRASVDRGIIVVEAGANGGVDLDAFQDVQGREILNRNSPDFRDSGAIMVGAASSGAPHGRLGFSNFGSRIDCFAWGEHIDTSGDGAEGRDKHEYTTDFGGTSGASPIVTGCAVLLQSLRRSNGQSPFTPAEIRALLADSALNTSSANPGFDLIGVMPDLQSIVQQRIGALTSRSHSIVVTE